MFNTRNNHANNNKKSICIFSALFNPSMGGVEAYTENLAYALANEGHRITIVTMNTHYADSFERHGNVDVIRLPAFNALNGRYPLERRNANYRIALNRLTLTRPDYVLVNTRFYPLSITGLSFSRKLGITPILIEHGSAHLTMGNPAANAAIEATEHILTAVGKRYHPACYAVSKKASVWLNHFGLASKGELPNAIDADKFASSASARNYREELGISPETLLVASAGRLIPEKGVLQLAQTAQMIEQNQADIHVVMAGTGPLEKQLKETSSSNLHLLGKLNHADLAALLSQANLYCLPSRSEGFATTLLEAAACETASVVTDVGGTDELIPNEEFGVIIPNMRPETIAHALYSAAKQRDEIQRQGKAAAKRVREIYSWQRTASSVLRACEEANPQNSLLQEHAKQ